MASGLPSDDVWTIDEDGSGGVWAGFYGGEIARVSSAGIVRTVIPSQAVAGRPVVAVKRDRDGEPDACPPQGLRSHGFFDPTTACATNECSSELPCAATCCASAACMRGSQNLCRCWTMPSMASWRSGMDSKKAPIWLAIRMRFWTFMLRLV